MGTHALQTTLHTSNDIEFVFYRFLHCPHGFHFETWQVCNSSFGHSPLPYVMTITLKANLSCSINPDTSVGGSAGQILKAEARRRRRMKKPWIQDVVAEMPSTHNVFTLQWPPLVLEIFQTILQNWMPMVDPRRSEWPAFSTWGILRDVNVLTRVYVRGFKSS